MAHANYKAPTITNPSTIVTSGTLALPLLRDTAGALSIGATLSNAGTITCQRYADLVGNVAVGSLITQTFTANANAVLTVNDAKPYASFAANIINGGTTTGTLTAFSLSYNSGATEYQGRTGEVSITEGSNYINGSYMSQQPLV